MELALMLGEELPEHNAFQYTYVSAVGRMAFLEWAYEDATTRVRDGADSGTIRRPVATRPAPMTSSTASSASAASPKP